MAIRRKRPAARGLQLIRYSGDAVVLKLGDLRIRVVVGDNTHFNPEMGKTQVQLIFDAPPEVKIVREEIEGT